MTEVFPGPAISHATLQETKEVLYPQDNQANLLTSSGSEEMVQGRLRDGYYAQQW
jgi:hypothetical protein